MTTRNETKARLIELGIAPARLPDNDVWNLRRSALTGADLREANLRWANLREADLRGAIISWNSHDLLAEIARRAAGDDLNRRMAAGLILISRDWCWEKFIAAFDDNTKDWLGSVFAPYVKDGDDAPDIVRQYVKGE